MQFGSFKCIKKELVLRLNSHWLVNGPLRLSFVYCDLRLFHRAPATTTTRSLADVWLAGSMCY